MTLKPAFRSAKIVAFCQGAPTDGMLFSALPRSDARRTTGATREVDSHRPTALRHAANVVLVVHALVLALVRGRRCAKLTLGVCRNRGTQSWEERVTGVSRQRFVSFTAFATRLSVQLIDVEGLRDPASVLPRRTLGARQRFVIASLRDGRLLSPSRINRRRVRVRPEARRATLMPTPRAYRP
jgi:hypothetical protein